MKKNIINTFKDLFYTKAKIKLRNNNGIKKGFSIAYAIVALVVTAITLVAITPVLTRKLPNLATSTLIKNPKGWYETYWAPDAGAKYCDKCMQAHKNGESCTECGEAPVPESGNPEYTPFVVNTDDLHEYERYCKTKLGGEDECGYPKERWPEGTPEGTPEDKPHKCSDGCKFIPTKGVSKYEVFAIGGGGAPGSAVAEKPASISSDYKKNIQGLKGDSGLPKQYNDDKGDIDANFIDVSKINDTTGKELPEYKLYEKNSSGEEVGGNDSAIAWNYIYTVIPGGDFHVYPTETTSESLAKLISKAQIKKLSKELGKGDDPVDFTRDSEKLSNRYYLFTKVPGAYNYGQPPEYTLMPEWVKLDGTEQRYQCLGNYEPNCKKQGETIPDRDEIAGKDYLYKTKGFKYITDWFKKAASVACSGGGGNGGNAVCTATAGSYLCSWMIPSSCPADTLIAGRNFIHIDQHSLQFSCSASGSSMGSEAPGKSNTNCKSGCNQKMKLVSYRSGNTTYHKYVCDYYQCNYQHNFNTRKCTTGEKPYTDSWVNCPCQGFEKTLPDVCGATSNTNDMTECYEKSLSLPLNPTNAEDMANLQSIIQSNIENGLVSEITTYTGGQQSGGITLGIDAVSYIPGTSQPFTTSTLDAGKITDTIAKEMAEAEGERALAVSVYKGFSGPPTDCKTIKSLTRAAYGGVYGRGTCTYRWEDNKKGKNTSISTDGKMAITKGPAPTAGCDTQNNGENGDDAKAKINGCVFTAKGGTGGTGGFVHNPPCNAGDAINGKPGSRQASEMSCSTRGGEYDRGKQDSNINNGELPDCGEGGCTGTKRKPGRYNWKYKWFMPVVAKHLMFGTAGSNGENVHTMITLTEDQKLTIKPGKNAKSTDYKSGKTGADGGSSTITSTEAKINITAHGGKGGVGSQKTDPYLLCNIADKTGDKNAPCYFSNGKQSEYTGNHKTHWWEGEGENKVFKGIQAILPKENDFGKSVKMSKALSNSNPGTGGMGYGTESVSDFICEARRVNKYDEVEGKEELTQKEIIKTSGNSNNSCKGNARLKYIKPNGFDYSAGTGVVVILW